MIGHTMNGSTVLVDVNSQQVNGEKVNVQNRSRMVDGDGSRGFLDWSGGSIFFYTDGQANTISVTQARQATV